MAWSTAPSSLRGPGSGSPPDLGDHGGERNPGIQVAQSPSHPGAVNSRRFSWKLRAGPAGEGFGLEWRQVKRESRDMITIQASSGDEWIVTVKAGATTDHRVRVIQADLDRFGAGRPAEDLLRESFRFLLEREPNTSILSSFDLPVIGRYFPEYEREIRQRLAKGA
jgi:hypothetical protein